MRRTSQEQGRDEWQQEHDRGQERGFVVSLTLQQRPMSAFGGAWARGTLQGKSQNRLGT